jgi:hypothetical protein
MGLDREVEDSAGKWKFGYAQNPKYYKTQYPLI